MIDTYVINLDHSPDRLERFRTVNAHIGEFLRFPAVDGSAVARSAVIETGDMLEDCPYGPGTLGCALSHVGLWRMAMAQKRTITVMEDDVIVSDAFVERSRALLEAAPPDWEIILWGYVYGGACKVWVDLGVAAASLDFFSKRVFSEGAEFQSMSHSRSLYRLLNCFGTQAYTITPQGARRLLGASIPLRKRVVAFAQPGVRFVDRGIDGPVNAAYPDMGAYICVPPLVIHDNQPAPSSVRRQLDADQQRTTAAP